MIVITELVNYMNDWELVSIRQSQLEAETPSWPAYDTCTQRYDISNSESSLLIINQQLTVSGVANWLALNAEHNSMRNITQVKTLMFTISSSTIS